MRSDIARRYIHEASFATWPAVLDFRATQGPAYTTSIGMMIYETCNFAHTILHYCSLLLYFLHSTPSTNSHPSLPTHG